MLDETGKYTPSLLKETRKYWWIRELKQNWSNILGKFFPIIGIKEIIPHTFALDRF